MTAVILGAFGAHALKNHLSDSHLNAFEVGVRYQMYHALAFIGIAILLFHFQHSFISVGASIIFIGLIFFSGSLYTLALTGINAFGAVTPIGGALLIIGWIFIVIGLWKS